MKTKYIRPPRNKQQHSNDLIRRAIIDCIKKNKGEATFKDFEKYIYPDPQYGLRLKTSSFYRKGSSKERVLTRLVKDGVVEVLMKKGIKKKFYSFRLVR